MDRSTGRQGRVCAMVSRLDAKIEFISEFGQRVSDVAHRVLKHRREARGEAKDPCAGSKTLGPVRPVALLRSIFVADGELYKILVAEGGLAMADRFDFLPKVRRPVGTQMYTRNREILVGR